MKRKHAILAVLLLVLCLAARAESDGDTVEYYYENICESCTPEEDFAARYQVLTGQPISEVRFTGYNVLTESGRDAYNAMLARFGEERINLPAVVVNGRLFAGTSAIRDDLPAYAVSRMASTDSAMYYLYLTACESCAEAEKLLDALPEAVSVSRGGYTFESAVRLTRVNINEAPEYAYALLNAYGVPDEDRLAPILLAGKGYWRGAESIQGFLNYRLPRGAALESIAVKPVEGSGGLPALAWGGCFSAGLVAGLNPCALSMLLMFLSILLSSPNRSAGRMVVIFLAVKFAVYLLIGCCLLEVFTRWNPAWLPGAAKLILTAVSTVLIALNLWDAFQARRLDLGRVKNQLPAALRRMLHHRIAALAGARIGLPAAVILLAVLVSAGEFLCAGQLYLSVLLARLLDGTASPGHYGMLVVYCAGFLLPSALLSTAVVRGRSALAASSRLSGHMAVIKLAIAVAHAGILAWAWLT